MIDSGEIMQWNQYIAMISGHGSDYCSEKASEKIILINLACPFVSLNLIKLVQHKTVKVMHQTRIVVFK